VLRPRGEPTVLGPTGGSKGKGQDSGRDAALDVAARGGRQGGSLGMCRGEGSDGSCGAPTGEQREREGWKVADDSTWRQGPPSTSLLRRGGTGREEKDGWGALNEKEWKR
jgi:hypothetical protein